MICLVGINYRQPSPNPFLEEGELEKKICGDTPRPGSIRMLHLRKDKSKNFYKGAGKPCRGPWCPR
jgi:hypothetical protein